MATLLHPTLPISHPPYRLRADVRGADSVEVILRYRYVRTKLEPSQSEVAIGGTAVVADVSYLFRLEICSTDVGLRDKHLRFPR